MFELRMIWFDYVLYLGWGRALSLSVVPSLEPALIASWFGLLCLAISKPLFPWSVWRSPKHFSPSFGNFLLVLTISLCPET